MKRNYDSKAELHRFERGDAVWLHDSNTKGRMNKFRRRWTGPYTVIQRINDNIYRIQKSAKSRAKVVHHDHLKLYEGKDKPSWFKFDC